LQKSRSRFIRARKSPYAAMSTPVTSANKPRVNATCVAGGRGPSMNGGTTIATARYAAPASTAV